MAMNSRILILQGHPDPADNHYCHALAESYAKGAQKGGHEVRRLDVSHMDFPLIRSRQDYEEGTVPDSILEAQQMINWANHLVFI